MIGNGRPIYYTIVCEKNFSNIQTAFIYVQDFGFESTWRELFIIFILYERTKYFLVGSAR